jgi:hypothetical protein
VVVALLAVITLASATQESLFLSLASQWQAAGLTGWDSVNATGLCADPSWEGVTCNVGGDVIGMYV